MDNAPMVEPPPSQPGAPALVFVLRGLATFGLGASALVLVGITVLDLIGVGAPGCMPGHDHTLGEALGLIGISWALGLLPGAPAVMLLWRGRRTPVVVVVTFFLAGLAVLGVFLGLMMNVFSTMC